jgi:hypothetical protein
MRYLILAVLFALGCSGEYDDEGAMGEDDIGQAEQALGIQGNGAAGWTMGVIRNKSPALSSCTLAQATSAECILPRNRVMNYCIAMLPAFGGFTNATEVGEVRAALAPNVAAINAQVNAFGDPSTNWVLTVSPSGATCPPVDITHTTIVKFSVPGSGSNNLSDYLSVSLSPLLQAPLTENPAGYNGSAYVNQGSSFTIDLADVHAKNSPFLLQQACAKGALAVIGVGATGANTGFATAATIQTGGFAEMTAGQACRLDKYTTIGSTTLDWSSSSTCANN